MNNRILALTLLIVVFFSACKSRKYSRNNKQIEKAANKANPDAKSYTTINYIEAFKAVAIEEMNKYGIPASITLAQGILESGSGNSSLASMRTTILALNVLQTGGARDTIKTMIRPMTALECTRMPGNLTKTTRNFKRKRYSFLFELDKNDYKNWARGLKQAGYATNPKYPDMLISVIDRYQLYQYDQPESEKDKIKREDKVFSEINANIPNEKKKFTPVETPPSNQIVKNTRYVKNISPYCNRQHHAKQYYPYL